MKWLLNMVIVCLSITATAQLLAVLETSGNSKTVFSCENGNLYLTKTDENKNEKKVKSKRLEKEQKNWKQRKNFDL